MIETIFGKGPGQVFLRFGEDGDARIYLSGELKEFRVSLVKRNGRHVHLGQALKVMTAKTKDWNEKKLFVLGDILFFMNNTRSDLPPKLVQEFGAGFICGMLLQRLFTNQGVQTSITERVLGAGEMDSLLKENAS